MKVENQEGLKRSKNEKTKNFYNDVLDFPDGPTNFEDESKLPGKEIYLNKFPLKLTYKTVKKTKKVGLGFKIPRDALQKKYIDKNCPFNGNISIRGRLIRGKVVSTKMNRTIIVRRDYLHWIPKYKRFEKRHKNIPCHCSPCFRIQEGDFVTVGQCRPISKTIRFNVVQMNKQINKKEKKKI